MGGKKVLVIGGSFSGLCVARDLKSEFMVTIVDAKEFFEYTPGVLRAYVKPAHLDALTFTVQPVIEAKMGCKFIWGEVKTLDGESKTAVIKPIFGAEPETICFDYCVICAGCNFGPFHKWGESLWFPTIHEEARAQGSWPHIDERFLEGRRRHILEEYGKIQALNDKAASILVVGQVSLVLSGSQSSNTSSRSSSSRSSISFQSASAHFQTMLQLIATNT